MRAARRAWPLLVLLAEVLAFFRHILFYGHYAIPWDFRSYHLAQAWFTARSFARGELPLWDPFIYCGMPFYANITTQLFYPPAIVAILLSNWTGGHHLLSWLELQLVAHVLAAGVFTYCLLRRLGTDRAAALVGATAYQLGAYMASQTEHLGAIDVAAWLPLAWLCVLALAEQFRWRAFAGLAAALAMSVLAGFPAATAVVFVSCVLLALIRMRALVSVALACVWALLLTAIQILPTVQLARLSVAQYRSDWLRTGGGMPLQGLVSLVMPNHYRIFQFDAGTWKLPWDPTFLYTYGGIVALALALAAVALRKHPLTLTFAPLTLCAALWMLGDSTPVGRTIFVLLPAAVKGPLYAQFALAVLSLGMAVLAGFGAQHLLESRGRWLAAALVIAVAAHLIAVSSGRPINTVDERLDPGVAYNHYDRYPQIPAEIRRVVNRNVPPWRVDLMHGSHDMVSAAPLFEYPTANGDDPFALVRYMQVRLSFCKGERWGRYYEVADPASPLLGLLNVRYLIESGGTPAPPGLTKTLDLPGTQVFENPRTLPRFFLVKRTRRAASMEEALALLRSPDFNTREEAVVESTSATEPRALASGTVRMIEYGARELRLETNSPAPAFLVTSETAYPGWHAWIDGQEHPLITTNVAFRGLTVPAGKHIVKMRFDPGILRLAAWLSVAAWMALILVSRFGDNKQAKGSWSSKTN